jgi:hypothetical protein
VLAGSRSRPATLCKVIFTRVVVSACAEHAVSKAGAATSLGSGLVVLKFKSPSDL